jgi:hypothetical protein
MLGADGKPPQIAVKQRVLMPYGKRGHDEADQLAAVVHQPGPGDVRHRVGVGQGPGNRGYQAFLIRP